MELIKKISKSPEDTFNISKEIALGIRKGNLLVGLDGNLGAGKTVFAKGFAEGLGVKELINSPTFLGITESYSGRIPFIHMDFYMKVQQSETIKHFLNNDGVVLIEWIQNFNLTFKDKLKPNTSVYIEYIKDNENNTLENERLVNIQHY